MLNYIYKHVNLPKMVPLKWGVEEFGMFGCYECAGGILTTLRVERKTPNEVVHAPTFIVGWCCWLV